jgi:carboxymethylenebutenolidase
MGDVRYQTSDGELPGYLATPAGSGPWPGVVVIMDALGLSRDIRNQADRLAREGYLALAPNLYARGPRLRCVSAVMRSSRSGVGQAYDDIAGARSWLAAREDCTGRIGVIGFCMGGGFALLCAPGGEFAVSSVNYGFVPDDIDDRLATGSCPIVGSFGQRDRLLPGHAQRLEAALTWAGITHDVKDYPGVGHSFLNRFPVGPLGPLLRVVGLSYDETVAQDAWRRILAFFAKELRG